jgi:hypothetical protein
VSFTGSCRSIIHNIVKYNSDRLIDVEGPHINFPSIRDFAGRKGFRNGPVEFPAKTGVIPDIIAALEIVIQNLCGSIHRATNARIINAR